MKAPLKTAHSAFGRRLVKGRPAVLVDVCHSFDEAVRNATHRARREGVRHMVTRAQGIPGARVVWRLEEPVGR